MLLLGRFVPDEEGFGVERCRVVLQGRLLQRRFMFNEARRRRGREHAGRLSDDEEEGRSGRGRLDGNVE